MDPRLLRIRASLRADAALAVVEAIHIGNLSSFEVDAYIECNIRADAYETIYCKCLVLKMAAYPEVDTFAPAACASYRPNRPRHDCDAGPFQPLRG